MTLPADSGLVRVWLGEAFFEALKTSATEASGSKGATGLAGL